MATLHLTLKKKWFDMIASDIKKEEYREQKPYWYNRLALYRGEKRKYAWWNIFLNTRFSIDMEARISFQKYDYIVFKNGYAKDARIIIVEFKGIEIKEGNPEWGAEPGLKYFVITLGNIVF